MDNPPLRRTAFALLAMMAVAACRDGGTQASQGPADVGVVTIAAAPADLVTELPGRTSPFMVSEVRPQIGGILLRRLFEEGSMVSKGQLLYQINPAPYQAAVNRAKAELARAQATLLSTNNRAARARDLVKIDAVSQQDADDAISAQGEAVAAVGAARATLEAAQIDLGFTHIVAPISGRIGRSAFTPGALVTTGQAAPLATIQALDPIYVDVARSSTELLRLKKAFAIGAAQEAQGAPVRLTLPDGSLYPLPGRLKFSEVSVDPSSGSVILRAVFPNPQGTLLPGMYVKARLVEGIDERALLAPQRGVSRDERGNATALVVGAGNRVEKRTLETIRTVGDRWLVSKGLQAGDRLIVDGLMSVSPGDVVRPVTVRLPSVKGQ